MRKNAILVTGGAGYIGSHVVRQLGERGENIVVLDDLSSGHRGAVLYGDLVVGRTDDAVLVDQLIRDFKIDTVLHFAAFTAVPESVANPLKYYHNNTVATERLLRCCQENKIRHFVFSSTAAVYAMPDNGIAAEASPTVPNNPYGRSKLASEWMLRDLAAASSLRHVTLRYFNVAGCDPQGRIGQSTPNATQLIKVACQAAIGTREKVQVFGTDYPTPDGTGVRDYIHVEDLADAHLKALDYLRGGGESTTVNCGYGHGYSVREVLEAVARLSQNHLTVEEAPRRPGDLAMMIADAARIRTLLSWSPKYDDLDKIVGSTLEWERRLAPS